METTESWRHSDSLSRSFSDDNLEFTALQNKSPFSKFQYVVLIFFFFLGHGAESFLNARNHFHFFLKEFPFTSTTAVTQRKI